MKAALLFAGALAAAAAASAAPYTIDPTHTFVTLEFRHQGLSTVRGRFDRKEGTIEFDRAGRTGKAEITIDTASISTGVPAFDALLKGADFFDVARHPGATFVSERFVFSGDKVAEIAGTLTVRGEKQPVTLKAVLFDCYTSPFFKREVCGGDFETTLRRSAFGLGGLPALAPDELRLVVQIEAVRQ